MGADNIVALPVPLEFFARTCNFSARLPPPFTFTVKFARAYGSVTPISTKGTPEDTLLMCHQY